MVGSIGPNTNLDADSDITVWRLTILLSETNFAVTADAGSSPKFYTTTSN